MQSTFVSPGPAYNWINLGSAQDNRIGYGGFIGYNSQWDDVVIGIEGNYIHGGFRALTSSIGYNPVGALPITSTTWSNAMVQSSDFGSLRLRAGYAVGSFLPYVFAGAGFGSQTVVRSVAADPSPVAVPSLWANDTQTKLVYGYSAGIGVDAMLTAGLFMRIEYEYQRITSTIESNAHAARAGLGYKF
jgi:opacity protein-like surface antigen